MIRFSRILHTALWLALTAGVAQAGVQDRSMPIYVNFNKTATGSVFGYKQDIVVEGVVEKDLGGINCNIHVKGKVLGNISALGGSVTIYKDAEIGGNIVSLGGEVNINEDVRPGGRLIHFFKPGETETRGWLASAKSKTAFFFAQSFFLFLLAMLTFYIFPNQIHEASFELTQETTRSAIFGVIALAVFSLGMFISFLLMVIGVGFLLFILFSCGLMVACGFGFAVIFYLLGQKIEALTKQRLPLMPSILVGVLAVGLLFYVPFLGALMSFAFLVFGLGIVIETRFGTNRQWFTRKSRYWSAD